MTIVVTDNCSRCRFTECVAVCPVACFHADEEMVYIDPDACIDCRACITACPVKAIYDADDLPAKYLHWTDINRARASMLPTVSDRLAPLPTAEARRRDLGL